jgi:hypothetical protein
VNGGGFNPGRGKGFRVSLRQGIVVGHPGQPEWSVTERFQYKVVCKHGYGSVFVGLVRVMQNKFRSIEYLKSRRRDWTQWWVFKHI